MVCCFVNLACGATCFFFFFYEKGFGVRVGEKKERAGEKESSVSKERA
jgi:hypothetical protein